MVPGTKVIANDYDLFQLALPGICRDAGLNLNTLVMADLTTIMQDGIDGWRAALKQVAN